MKLIKELEKLIDKIDKGDEKAIVEMRVTLLDAYTKLYGLCTTFADLFEETFYYNPSAFNDKLQLVFLAYTLIDDLTKKDLSLKMTLQTKKRR